MPTSRHRRNAVAQIAARGARLATHRVRAPQPACPDWPWAVARPGDSRSPLASGYAHERRLARSRSVDQRRKRWDLASRRPTVHPSACFFVRVGLHRYIVKRDDAVDAVQRHISRLSTMAPSRTIHIPPDSSGCYGESQFEAIHLFGQRRWPPLGPDSRGYRHVQVSCPHTSASTCRH